MLGIWLHKTKESERIHYWESRLSIEEYLFPKAQAKIDIKIVESRKELYDRNLISRSVRPHTFVSLVRGTIGEGVVQNLVIAQGIQESQSCTRIPAKNNCWGRKSKTGWLKWETIEEAIQDQYDYTKRHLVTCDNDMACYYGSYAEDPNYQKKVETILNTL